MSPGGSARLKVSPLLRGAVVVAVTVTDVGLPAFSDVSDATGALAQIPEKNPAIGEPSPLARS